MCFLDIKTLSERISLSAYTIRKLVAAGRIPVVRPSGSPRGKMLFHEGDVEAALRGKNA